MPIHTTKPNTCQYSHVTSLMHETICTSINSLSQISVTCRKIQLRSHVCIHKRGAIVSASRWLRHARSLSVQTHKRMPGSFGMPWLKHIFLNSCNQLQAKMLLPLDLWIAPMISSTLHYVPQKPTHSCDILDQALPACYSRIYQRLSFSHRIFRMPTSYSSFKLS